MAKASVRIYLGYEDEVIGDKNVTLINYTVNKIGGQPDWPHNDKKHFSTKCQLCGLHRLQIVQCYVPLPNSTYHRTLYVFACVNPNCWIQSDGWACVRSQVQDNVTVTVPEVLVPNPDTQVNWCSGANEWDENDNGDSANGNIINQDNAPSPNNVLQRYSDEDDESISYEMDSVDQAFGNLQVCDAHNANMSPVQGAAGAIGAPIAAAEIEGCDETELVSVDTPTSPVKDLQAILHETAELPIDLRNRLSLCQLQFVPKYIYVEEETRKRQNHGQDRVTELLNKYNQEIEAEPVRDDMAGPGAGDEEMYEVDGPLHGDVRLHTFLTRLKDNPEQILRYTRDASPLLGAPLPIGRELPDRCNRCSSPLICELQLMPFLSNSLALPEKYDCSLSHLHFLSVLIFTCSNSCWGPDDVFVKETVVFQQEV